MRLGDLDALKKEIENYLAKRQDVIIWESDMLNMINNAPTVEMPKYSLLPLAGDCDEAYKRGYNHGKAEALLRGRPKGEWILNKDENPECPYCHHSFSYWGNFCGNCGADLR